MGNVIAVQPFIFGDFSVFINNLMKKIKLALEILALLLVVFEKVLGLFV
jgi:hypothetical protein